MEKLRREGGGEGDWEERKGRERVRWEGKRMKGRKREGTCKGDGSLKEAKGRVRNIDYERGEEEGAKGRKEGQGRREMGGNMNRTGMEEKK